jgi:hypothetical protein
LVLLVVCHHVVPFRHLVVAKTMTRLANLLMQKPMDPSAPQLAPHFASSAVAIADTALQVSVRAMWFLPSSFVHPVCNTPIAACGSHSWPATFMSSMSHNMTTHSHRFPTALFPHLGHHSLTSCVTH